MNHTITPKRERIPVAILGAAGMVGQRFVQLLDNHPSFKVVPWLRGSDRAIGKKFIDACHWILPEPMPDWVKNMVITPTMPETADTPLVFSALPAEAARAAEPLFTAQGVAVCTNASAYRADADVPLLLPRS